MAKDRQTRGRASSIQTLPDDIKSKLDEMLRDSGTTQQSILEEVNILLEAAGVEKAISKSSLNRYATRMETIGANIRETRNIADMWVAKLGTKPTSEVTQIIAELMRTALFNLSMGVVEGDVEDISASQIKDIALAVQRLEKASEISAKRDKEMRKAFAEEAAKQVDDAVGEAGLSAAAVQDIKDKILGIAA